LRNKFSFFVFILLFSCGLNAEIYKWTDENGKVHFSDSEPEKQQTEKVQLDNHINGFVNPEIPLAQTPGQVVLYATEWCGYCRKARSYFKKNNITYIEKDIEKSAEAKREHKALGGGGVPVITYKDQVIRGFSKAKLNALFQD